MLFIIFILLNSSTLIIGSITGCNPLEACMAMKGKWEVAVHQTSFIQYGSQRFLYISEETVRKIRKCNAWLSEWSSGSLCFWLSVYFVFLYSCSVFSRMFLVCDHAYLVTLIPACPFIFWCCQLTWPCSRLFSDLSSFASLDSVTLQLSTTVCCQSRPGTWSRALSCAHWSNCPLCQFAEYQETSLTVYLISLPIMWHPRVDWKLKSALNLQHTSPSQVQRSRSVLRNSSQVVYIDSLKRWKQSIAGFLNFLNGCQCYYSKHLRHRYIARGDIVNAMSDSAHR